MKKEVASSLVSTEKKIISTWNQPWDIDKIQKWNEIQTAKNLLLVDPLTATLIGAGIGALVGIGGSVINTREHKRILANQEKIIKYLKTMSQKLEEIYQINERILLILSQLPEIIKRELLDHELDARYITLYETYFRPFCRKEIRTLNDRREGYFMLIDSFNYVAINEYRFCYFHRLITLSEFILCITKNTALDLVKESLVRKKEDFITALSKLRTEIDSEIGLLKKYSISEYIINCNLQNITKLNDFKYELTPPRFINYTVKESYNCHSVHHGSARHGNDWDEEVCSYRNVTKQRLDKEWLKRQTVFEPDLRNLLTGLNNKICYYKDLEILYKEFCTYYDFISSEKSAPISFTTEDFKKSLITKLPTRKK